MRHALNYVGSSYRIQVDDRYVLFGPQQMGVG